MSVPDFQSLMLPVLIAAVHEELTMDQTRQRVASELQLTPTDLAERLAGGQSKFANRIAWAKSYLEMAGLVQTIARGKFKITDQGKQVLSQHPSKIDINFLKGFPEYLFNRRGISEKLPASISPNVELPSNTITPEEQIELAYESLQIALQAELLERVVRAPWQFFERLVVDLLVAMGYGGGRAEMARAFARTGDEGIDGVVKEDALGLDVVYVQAKRWGLDRLVGRPEIQGFVGSLEGVRASKGVFATTASFSQPAREFVERISKRIVLIDGRELTRLLIDHGVAVRVARRYDINKIDEDYFVIED